MQRSRSKSIKLSNFIKEILKKPLTTTLLASTALLATIGAAQAQNLSYVGLEHTAISGNRGDGTSDTTASAGTLEAMYTYNLNSASRISFAGSYSIYNGTDVNLVDSGDSLGVRQKFRSTTFAMR